MFCIAKRSVVDPLMECINGPLQDKFCNGLFEEQFYINR